MNHFRHNPRAIRRRRTAVPTNRATRTAIEQHIQNRATAHQRNAMYQFYTVITEAQRLYEVLGPAQRIVAAELQSLGRVSDTTRNRIRQNLLAMYPYADMNGRYSVESMRRLSNVNLTPNATRQMLRVALAEARNRYTLLKTECIGFEQMLNRSLGNYFVRLDREIRPYL